MGVKGEMAKRRQTVVRPSADGASATIVIGPFNTQDGI